MSRLLSFEYSGEHSQSQRFFSKEKDQFEKADLLQKKKLKKVGLFLFGPLKDYKKNYYYLDSIGHLGLEKIGWVTSPGETTEDVN